MKKIIAVTGLSGTGKTTIARKVADELGVNMLVTYTTRPKRPGEINGYDYNFITDKKYEELKKNGELILDEEFRVAGGAIWKYACKKRDFSKHRVVLAVLSPQGVWDLKSAGYDVFSVEVKVPEDIRLDRIISRNDNQTVAEVERRSREDKLKFEKFLADVDIENVDFNKALISLKYIVSKFK